MILKGSQRAGGRQLASHLLKADENEHVEVHELRGFLSDDLHSAFQEAYAASKGTRAKQYLFSLSLNPPPDAQVSIEDFEAAIDHIEKELGLDDQPRGIVFHEKDGRRHAHAVWSRIDTTEMKAINLPHYKLKLRDVAKELYLEHGWELPRGFINREDRDPLNFTHDQWQQAQRNGDDPQALKRLFRKCWENSDSRKAFIQSMQSYGYTLAQGDRRGFVAVDHRGEVLSISRYAGVKAKEVRERLGDPNDLPSVEEAKAEIAQSMTNILKTKIVQAEKFARLRSAKLQFERGQALQQQRHERELLQAAQDARWREETRMRAERLSKGFRGVWDRLTGKYANIKRQNEREALLALQRDRQEKDALIFSHIQQRRTLSLRVRAERTEHARELRQIRRDIVAYQLDQSQSASALRTAFRDAVKQRRRLTTERSRDHSRDLER